MIGQTISHYQIVEKLGEGGMGVVYKAQDTKLNRLVALKFLPEHVRSSEPDKARFLQEAQAAAALSHPHICTIHAIEEADAYQFIVMEYVDGSTLREKLPVQKTQDVLTYAVQIGEALQEAHNKRIVHRDIKADNVMVNSQNQIKVMDFGLAKLKGSLKLTRTSSTVGTIAYMPPEQIQGGEVDARSDIFSFGVLLFEMLTGHLPFRGEHEAAIVYSIVNEEPEPVQKFLRDASSELVHILHRALEKDPNDRYQTVGDMLIDLRRSKKETSKVSRPSEDEIKARMPSIAFTSKPKILWLGILAVVVIGGLGLLLLMKPSSGISENLIFKPLSVPFTTIWYPGLSADGNWIAFPATDENNVTEIYYMHVSGGEPKRLTNDSLFKFMADISPDGSKILYGQADTRRIRFFPLQLFTISPLGGSRTKVADSSHANRWSPDGKFIAFASGSPRTGGPTLWIMNADGSNKRVIFEDPPGRPNRLSVDWSPDGKSISWIRNFDSREGRYQEIIIHELETGKERQLTFDKKNVDEVLWMPQGEIIFSSNRNGPSNLWAIPSEGGTPVQITRGAGPDLGIKASEDGRRVLYLQQTEVGSLKIADVSGMNAKQITPEDQLVINPSFSPDARQIAFLAGDSDPIRAFSYNVYVIDRQGRNRRQLTTAAQYMVALAWSPDGRSIAYSWRADTTFKTAIVDVVDPAQSRVIGNGVVIAWLNDGRSLNVIRNATSWRLPIEGGAEEKIFEDSTAVFPSPDGAKLAVWDVRFATRGLWVKVKNKSLRKLAERISLTSAYTAYALPFQWSPDGKSIIYALGDERWIASVETGKAQRYMWKNPEAVGFDALSPDGKQTVFVKRRMNAKLILIDNFH